MFLVKDLVKEMETMQLRNNSFSHILKEKIILVLVFVFFSACVYAQEDNLQVALQAYKDGLYDIAESILKKEIESNILAPHSAKLLLAKVYIKEKKFKDALSLLVELNVESDLSDNLKYEVYSLLGEVYMELGSFNQAKTVFEKMLNFDTVNARQEAIDKLCDMFMEKGNFLAAKKLLARYDSDTHREIKEILLYKKAQLSYQQQDYDKAKQLFEKFINSFPDSKYLSSAYFYLGKINYILGRYKEAIRYFDKIALIYKGKSLGGYALQAKAWALIRLSDFDEAEKCLKMAQQAIGKVTDTISFARAFIDYKKANYKKAKKELELFLQRYANSIWRRDVLYWLAEANFAIGDYSQALTLYSQVLSYQETTRKIPDLDDVITNSYYGIAWCYLNKGDYQQAIEYFQRVADLNDDPLVKVAALVKVADTLLLAGQYQKALNKYFEIQRQFPQSYYSDYILYQIANALMKMGDYEKAVLSYEELIENFPTTKYLLDAKYNLSMAYFNLGNFVRTIEILSKIKQEKKDKAFQPHLDYILANAYFNQRQYKKALHLFRRIIEKLPKDSERRIEVEYELAWCYYRLGRVAEAKRRFREIVEKYPNELLSREVLLWLAEKALSESNYSQAEILLDKFVKRYPDSPQRFKAYYDLAWLYYMKGDKQKALDIFSKYILLDDNNMKADFYLARAYIYEDLGKLEKALADVKMVIDKFPSYSRKALEMLSDIYYKMHRYADSAYALEQLLETQEKPEKRAKLMFRIAKIWEEAGEFDKAVEFYIKLAYNTKLQDKQLKVKAVLKAAKLYEKKGKIKEAIRLYKKIADMDVPESKLAKEKIMYYEHQEVGL